MVNTRLSLVLRVVTTCNERIIMFINFGAHLLLQLSFGLSKVSSQVRHTGCNAFTTTKKSFSLSLFLFLFSPMPSPRVFEVGFQFDRKVKEEVQIMFAANRMTSKEAGKNGWQSLMATKGV